MRGAFKDNAAVQHELIDKTMTAIQGNQTTPKLVSMNEFIATAK